MERIDLDGSYLEGGGALVRVALALSTITGIPIKINNIRAGRPQPGLKAQHLHAIKTLKELCNAKTSEIELGTEEFWYIPNKIKKGTYEVNIGTAGSITLLLQALILPSLFAPGKVTFKIKGGTCGKWQASVDYLQNILLPYLERFVTKIEIKLNKRGYYPKGGGEVEFSISPRFKLKDYDSLSHLLEDIIYRTCKIELIKQGELEYIKGIINCSADLMDKEVSERISNAIKNSLQDLEVPIKIKTAYSNTLSTGGEILIWGIFSKNSKVSFDNPVMISSDMILDKNKSSEQIGKEVAESFRETLKTEGATDKFLADQLIQFMALLPGSKIKVAKLTDHTLTNIYVCEKFLDIGFKIDKENKIIECLEKEEN